MCVCVAQRDFVCSMTIEGRSSQEAALSLVVLINSFSLPLQYLSVVTRPMMIAELQSDLADIPILRVSAVRT